MERTTSSSSLRSTRLSLSAVLYSVYTYTTVRPSRCRQHDARQPKLTTEKVPLADVIREKKCSTRSGPQADKLLRSRPSSHVDARPSTTKILGPRPNPLARLPCIYRPSATDSFLKKGSSSFLLFSFSLFFSSAPSLRCSFRFSSALLILPLSGKFISCTQSKS